MTDSYLPNGLPTPAPAGDGLDQPYWEAAARHELVAQQCLDCERWQWGPEWLCHHCHSFDLTFARPPGATRLFSWTRAWHPVHPALGDHGPYVVAVVDFPDADGIRMVGNLIGDPLQDLPIGAEVEPVFEDHPSAADGESGDAAGHTLVQWRLRS